MKRGGTSHFSSLHWPLIIVVAMIATLGIYNLHSSAAAHAPNLYLTQLGWFGLGAMLCVALLTVDYRVTESIAYIAYVIVCVLLLAVLIHGRTILGARRWLAFGPIVFQPSELAKVGTIFCLARYFAHRVHPHGYTLNVLLRPLNPSRPLAVIAGLIVSWNKPWVVDPIGELARSIRKTLTADIPAQGDLLWFRLLIAFLLVLGCALTIVAVVRLEKQRALFDPWPEGRRRRLIVMFCIFYVTLGLVLATFWHTPFLRDPFGYLISTLHAGAGKGGPYALIRPNMTLRIVWATLAAVYMAASIFSLRRGDRAVIDIILAPIDLLALPALLILVEPDLGTAGIVGFIGMTMILVVGIRLRSLITLGILGAIVAVIGWAGILKDYQKRRILTFIDPEHDIMGAGWNAVQSLIAVGSGRWLGKGHREGTQSQLSFLPEQHTDFAFSVWGEEQGFIGCVIVLVLYAALLAMAYAIAADAREPYGALLATGVAALITWQALINVSMVIGVFPVVGITLPMFSYGGSSLLTILFGIGLLLNIHWRRRAY